MGVNEDLERSGAALYPPKDMVGMEARFEFVELMLSVRLVGLRIGDMLRAGKVAASSRLPLLAFAKFVVEGVVIPLARAVCLLGIWKKKKKIFKNNLKLSNPKK